MTIKVYAVNDDDKEGLLITFGPQITQGRRPLLQFPKPNLFLSCLPRKYCRAWQLAEETKPPVLSAVGYFPQSAARRAKVEEHD